MPLWYLLWVLRLADFKSTQFSKQGLCRRRGYREGHISVGGTQRSPQEVPTTIHGTPPPQRNPKISTEGSLHPTNSLHTRKQRRERGDVFQVTPLLSGRAGPKPRCLHQGRCPRLGRLLSLSFAAGPSSPLPLSGPDLPRPPHIPPPSAGSRTSTRGPGWELRGAPFTGPARPSPPRFLLLPGRGRRGGAALCSKDATQITSPNCG